MGLLRTANRIASNGLRSAGPLSATRLSAGKPAFQQLGPLLQTSRCFAMRSMPRFGHNLEDHYDMSEFVTRMHNPLGEYFIWFFVILMNVFAFAPMMHTNYYFTGRFLPKDQGNTQLC